MNFSTNPTTLIYLKPERGRAREFTVEPEWHRGMGDPPFKDAAFISHGRPKGASGHPLTLFSDASLESVVHASVFRRKLVRPSQPDKYYCMGISFTYQNGGKRAVGECRIGVDGCVDYEKPVEMFHDHFSVGLAEWRPKSSSGGQ